MPGDSSASRELTGSACSTCSALTAGTCVASTWAGPSTWGAASASNLVALPPSSLSAWTTTRARSETARQRGLDDAITSAEFDERYPQPPARPEFDGILLAHVLERMTRDQALALLRHYLPHATGKVAVICPQEKGYTTDSTTRVTSFDGADIAGMLEEVGLRVRRVSSFPFPRVVGNVFPYNETVVLADRP